MTRTVWVTGCNSSCLGTNGVPELFPWLPERYTELLREPESADFDVR